MDEELLKQIVVGLVTPDKQRQRQVVDTYMTEDVKFVHILGATTGRDNLYYVYRAASTLLDYKLEFVEFVITEDKAVIWVNLKLIPALSLLRIRRTVPTLVLLHFAKGADGKPRICLQYDHHSMYTLVWALGSSFMLVAEYLLRPIQGYGLVTTGRAVDAFQAAWACGMALLMHWLGALLQWVGYDSLWLERRLGKQTAGSADGAPLQRREENGKAAPLAVQQLQNTPGLAFKAVGMEPPGSDSD